ncbi:unnamed protein product [Echinostoma caproni]|uniref:DRBM domain-containing protein n=1 Tax=Echinostoma caproni TaxID=27848 RepID=A0A183ARE7_9TREM|nr:unnamed protein product [Echinostoma caproni]
MMSTIHICPPLDSLEAQSVSRSISLRRSNSCSQMDDYFDLDAPNVLGRACSHQLRSLSPAVSPTTTAAATMDADRATINNPGLRLLSQLAVFCLVEHQSGALGSQSSPSSKRPSSQLISLCQRLRIPCQFTDHQAKFDNLEQMENPDATTVLDRRYTTVLAIGIPPTSARTLSPHTKATTDHDHSPVVIKGFGRTKEAAHDDAVLTAFRLLARVNGSLTQLLATDRNTNNGNNKIAAQDTN